MSAESSTHALDGTAPEDVLRRVDEAICAFDTDLQITFVNDRAAAMLDRAPEELLGQTVRDVVPDMGGTGVGERLREAMSVGTPTRAEHYDEDLGRWFRIRIYPDDAGATACFYDITEERGDQLDRQRHRRLFETVFDQTEDALVVAGADRRIAEFNPAAEQLFGYDASDVIGEPPRLLYADDDEYCRYGDHQFNDGTPVREETHRVEYERADGTTFVGETLWTSLRNSDGETLAFLGSTRDVSERIEYERALEAHNDVLRALQAISTDDGGSVDQRIDAVLELGCEYLGLDIGILSTVEDSEYTVEQVDAPDGNIQPGERFDLGATLCDHVVDAEELVAAADVGNSELADDPTDGRLGLASYIGAPVTLDGEQYGTLSFSQRTPRQRRFSQGERTIVRTFAQWIGTELSRRRSKQQAAANRDRLRQIIDLLPQLVFAKDRDNEFILANRAVADAYGTTVDAVEGATDADFTSSAAEAERFRQDDLAVIDSGEPKHIPEEPLTKANGETVMLQTTKIPYDPVTDDSEAVLGVATDITAAKQRERELEATTQRLNIALEGTNTGVWEINLETKDVIWTDSMERLFGLDSSTVDGTYEQFTEFIHPGDLPAVENAIDQLTEDGDTLHTEYRIRHDGGPEKWIEARAELLAGANTTRRLVGIATDITEQKQLETSLRESEQSLRELTSIASDTDRGFAAKLTALLELGTERLGLPIGFLNRIDDDTQHIVQAVGDHPEFQPGVSAPTSESYCRKTIEQATPLTVQDAVAEGWEGDPAYDRFELGCYIGGSISVDGELYGTLCFADRPSRDHEFTNTERTFVELLVQWISHELSTAAVETKLREINDTAQQLMTALSDAQIASLALENARSILETPVIGIWWYDEERDVLVPDRMTEEATEYVPEQPTFERGAALAWEAFDAGELQAYGDLSTVDVLHNEQTPLNSEVIVPLGEYGILSAGSVEYRSFSETDRNLLEVLSSTVESALARAEREAELRETRAALEQSNEELEQFAYAASHDLQEPLRTVSSYLTLLERRYGDELDGDAAEFIEFAVDGADRMRDMIQALLTYSRIDARGESFEAVDVSALFDRVTDSLSVRIDDADAIVSTPSTDATVRGDRSQLAQLFQNLVDNGINYNTGQPRVDISVRRHDGMVRFDVTDNGVGIAAEQVDGIFEMFQRLHTREEFEGTGIGLSICQKIVDRHGGDIEVQSRPGDGSTFRISLPSGTGVDG